jgi:transposase
MNTTATGVDIAKTVFQVHYVDMETGEVVNKPIKRGNFLAFFANRPPSLIGMEACGGAHHWARKLLEQGHRVRLMQARFVKAFNIGNKSDAADARAIWLAVQQPGKEVAIKTEAQQAVLAMHRMRQQLIKFRTMQMNGLRGLLTEYGEVMAKSRAALDEAMPEVLERLECRLPKMLIDSLRGQWENLEQIDQQIHDLERRLMEWKKTDSSVMAISAIPGVGLLTATAAVATIGDAKAFKSGRELAAWLGLVPRQTGSGGKINLLGISKRGDRYLRTLLIHGARVVFHHHGETNHWLKRMTERRPNNVVIVAQANKMARQIWAVLAKEQTFEPGHISIRPA